MMHAFNVSVGDQVFVGEGGEEVGAVREVAKDHLVIYIENAGDFRVSGPAVRSAHDGKVVLDPEKLEPEIAEAIGKAHAGETD
jgi:ribosomal protein L24